MDDTAKGLRLRLDERDTALLQRCSDRERLPKSQILRFALREYAESREIPQPRPRRMKPQQARLAS